MPIQQQSGAPLPLHRETNVCPRQRIDKVHRLGIHRLIAEAVQFRTVEHRRKRKNFF